MRARTLLLVTTLGTTLIAPPSLRASEVPDFSSLSIEELMQVEVTSVSRQEEKRFDAAAAVTVITRDDMRRTGALSIPEALRLVPGMDVAQIDANKWAVSARGFLGRFSNKLLVLVDGRSVYTPFFGGVEWDMVDVSIDDIERIEVIRGPGASLWGSNAVNGVVNIITRPANGDDGLGLAGVAGSHGGSGELRLSRNLREGMDVRVTALYRDRVSSESGHGLLFSDAAETVHAHARVDWAPDPTTNVLLQARHSDGRSGTTQLRFATMGEPEEVVSVDYDSRRTVVHGRASRGFGGGGGLTLGAYFVADSRNYGFTDYSSTTVDIELESSLSLARHEFLVGLGQRWITDRATSTPWVTFDEDKATHSITSGFAQDQFRIFHPALVATAGVKFESNSYSSNELEWQPNARLLWSPTPKHRLWAAAARAIRTPSLIDGRGRFLIYSTTTEEGLPVEVWAAGNSDFHSEELVAVELGYRVQPSTNFSVDIAGYLNRYQDLRGSVRGDPTFKGGPNPRVETELELTNSNEIRIRGVEVEGRWDPVPQLRLVAGGSYLSSRRPGNDPDQSGANLAIQSEYHIVPKRLHIRSLFDITESWELDTSVHFADGIETFDVDGYVRVDARIGWQPLPTLECSIGAQNLFQERHSEFGSWNWELAEEVERNFYSRVAWRF